MLSGFYGRAPMLSGFYCRVPMLSGFYGRAPMLSGFYGRVPMLSGFYGRAPICYQDDGEKCWNRVRTAGSAAWSTANEPPHLLSMSHHIFHEPSHVQ